MMFFSVPRSLCERERALCAYPLVVDAVAISSIVGWRVVVVPCLGQILNADGSMRAIITAAVVVANLVHLLWSADCWTCKHKTNTNENNCLVQVCTSPACIALRGQSCCRILPCGHACGGIRNDEKMPALSPPEVCWSLVAISVLFFFCLFFF